MYTFYCTENLIREMIQHLVGMLRTILYLLIIRIYREVQIRRSAINSNKLVVEMAITFMY